MTRKDDGGPAFPVLVEREELSNHDNYVKVRVPEGGMSLRDYFAAAALNGLLSNRDIDQSTCVRAAYQHADSMLRERAQ